MRSPAQVSRELRQQVATIIRETPDRVRAAVHPDWNPVFDTADARADCTRCRGRNYVLVPAPGAAGSDEHPAGDGAGAGPPSPALHLLLTCDPARGGCGAGVGALCMTADGRVTRRVHKARREPRRSEREK